MKNKDTLLNSLAESSRNPKSDDSNATFKTIQSLFEEQSAANPFKPAIIDGNQSINYQELNHKANQLAHYLRELGIKPDMKVALCMKRSIDLFIALLGILKAGAAYIPLDGTYPKERLFFCLEDNENPILIISAAFQEQFHAYKGNVLVFDEERARLNRQKITNPEPITLSQHLAYVIYTSGSTGIPKGVLIEQASVLNYFHWFVSYSQSHSEQRVDFSANFIFDMAITSTIIPLMHGMTLVICHDEIKKTAGTYLKQICDYEINLIKITPSYFKLLVHEVQNNPVFLPHLESIILGGENLSKVECEQWLNLYPHHRLFNEYGPTEVTVAVTQQLVCSENIADLGMNIPIGKPGPGMVSYILNQDRRPVAVGAVGELYVGGLGLARGYLNQTLLTQEKFIRLAFHEGRLYKTGDLCQQQEDGTIEYLGRIDSQIKIRGFRVELQELEQWLRTHPSIEDALIVVDEEGIEKRLIAYFILKEFCTRNLRHDELRQFFLDNLPEYMVPSLFIKVHHFPLTDNGKLDKKALPQAYSHREHPYRPPTSEIEKKLVSLWERELQIKPIGLLDNFFELGGHSLAAARIISDIQRIWGKFISLSVFYQANSLAELIVLIEKAECSAPKSIAQYKYLKQEGDKALPLGDFQLMLWLAQTFEPKASQLNIISRHRMQGQINLHSLKLAFDAVFQRNELFFYKILKLRPAQIAQKNLAFKLNEHDLSHQTEEELEESLQESVLELINYQKWSTHEPLLIARLFYLPNQLLELQLCMPHIITDDMSPEILVSELSKYYLLIQNPLIRPAGHLLPISGEKGEARPLKPDTHYQEYVLAEQEYAKTNLKAHIDFWDSYLKEASLFAFPSAMVVNKMQAQHLPYSSYFVIPREQLNALHDYCADNHFSFKQGLCASLVLALRNCCNNTYENQNIVLNLVKSTRDDQRYDRTIGCFLRTEPVKVSLGPNSSLLGLSRQLQQSELETNPYQRCSNLLKLACISTLRQQKRMTRYFLNSLIYIYTILFPWSKLNRGLLKIYQRLITFKRDRHFLININIHNNFVSTELQKNKDCFGLAEQNIQLYQYDLIQINALFDVCFFHSNNENYMVISANLHPDVRQQIAMEMIRLLQELQEISVCG